ncbi:MAG: zinc-ribbon domain-containing protein [Thermoplasmata archaeon]|nr:zinc-ribbon domain-containing protein [Thermoplasmata archaeon]
MVASDHKTVVYHQPVYQQPPPQPVYPPPQPQQQPQPQGRFCGSCGRSIPSDSAICPYCGAPVSR